MSHKLKISEMIIGGVKFFKYLLVGGLFNINLEVTKRCNAKCDFCDYWKEVPPKELKDYVCVVKKLDPLSVSLTGGEPLLRKDLEDIIYNLRQNFGFLYISLITNGSLLSYERGLRLWNAGLNELSISLDYLDKRHDNTRKIPGLTEHILDVSPKLANAGVNVCFNVVIKNDNLKDVPKIITWSAERGIKVSLSTYNWWRTNNKKYAVREDQMDELLQLISTIKQLKRKLGNVITSDYYLDRIPIFFQRGGVPGCTAGINWVQVTPDGMIKRCSDHPVKCSYTEWRKDLFAPTDCDKCWYSCRGAAQEPWTFLRLIREANQALNPYCLRKAISK